MTYYSNKKSDFGPHDYRSRNFKGVWQKGFIDDYVDRSFKRGLEDTIQEMADYTREHLPTHVYKFFRPTSYSLMSIESESLWLSKPHSFNDPFDSYVCIEKETFEKKYLLNELKKASLITKDGGHESLSKTEMWQINGAYSKDLPLHSWYYLSDKKYDKILKRILEDKSENLKVFVENTRMEARRSFRKTIDAIRDVELRITCFSNLTGDDDLARQATMWSHYAENHTGFCVKYALGKAADYVKVGLLPVKYTSKVPTLSVPNVLKYLDTNQEMMTNPNIAKASRKALITKSASWNYEKEWRLIVESERVDLLNNGSVSFPYAEAIYMGCRIEPNLKLYLASLAKRKKLAVYETYQNEERFKLDIWPTDLKGIKEEGYWNQLLTTRDNLRSSTKGNLHIERIYRKLDGLRMEAE